MPPKTIKAADFKGSGELTLEQWRNLEITGAASAPGRLAQNWGGSIIGYLCAKLANDNKSIENMRFHLAGTLFDSSPHKTSAANFWDDLNTEGAITFSLSKLNSSVFSFREGGLTSDLLDSSAFTTNWFLDGVPMSPEARTEAGIAGYTVRCHIVPNQVLVSGTWAAIHLTLFPLPLATLLEKQPLAVHHNFPGFKLYSANAMPIGFQTSKVFTDLNCGIPVLPGVLTGSDWDELPHTPSTSDLKLAVATIMRKVSLPDIKKGPDSLAKAWDGLLANGEAGLKATDSKLKEIWPLPPTQVPVLPLGMPSSPPPPNLV